VNNKALELQASQQAAVKGVAACAAGCATATRNTPTPAVIGADAMASA
jgi:hypothetical protein